MRRNARLAALGVAASSVVLMACQPPPMQISPVLDRPATLKSAAPGEQSDEITISGTISCTRSEPVDVFPTFSQGTRVDRPGETSIPCEPGNPRRWTLSFPIDPAFETGHIGAEVAFCTNPAEYIDEDCVTVIRQLDVVATP